MIELQHRLSDIRTEAVLELRRRDQSWSDIAWLLGVSRGRAWKLGQPRARVDSDSAQPAGGPSTQGLPN
jgi:hypothetical protein